ncbi:hypothetical protein [Metabacillus arenae]|uniref:Uncharacterized protein n=1 Tax=Metabacillus arenae TaxID=2771434 RepID=A0A926NGD6_9BACI|nr:hypothetical protein [Metabacillus arenae]MBD1379538.1 hypothetical protein [Metabacillus arenae]
MPENSKKPLDRNKHPEQVKSDRKSLHDRYKSEQNVDPIPLEEVKENIRDEKDKHGSKGQKY